MFASNRFIKAIILKIRQKGWMPDAGENPDTPQMTNQMIQQRIVYLNMYDIICP